MRRISLSQKEFYHIYNRGTDKRKVFLGNVDYERFVDSLTVFNTSINLNGRRFSTQLNAKNNDELVNIVAYCLMPNHFHLLLEQVAEDGISKFFQKMLTSYTLYFNKKQRRSGVLFQGVFKSSHIKTNERLLDLSKYIHRNPIKILSTSSSRDAKNLEKRLLNYPWSSFSCFAGDKNDCVVNEGKLVILNQFKSPRDYVKYVVSET